MIDRRHKWNSSIKPLIVGFICSIFLTLVAYFLFPSHRYLILGLITLQVLIQAVCFLQVGIEHKPHWSSTMFLFMILVAFLVIGGSLWIMSNLDYNVMQGMHSH